MLTIQSQGREDTKKKRSRAVPDVVRAGSAALESAEPGTFRCIPDRPAAVGKRIADAVGFRPDTPLREGLARFVAWYREFYKV